MKFRALPLVALLLVALPLVALLLLVPMRAFAQDVTGTYAFQVMSEDAAEAHPIAAGTFVLMEGSVPLDSLPADLAKKAQRESQWLTLFGKKTPSACFGFETSTSEVEGREFYGGIIPAGLTTWKRQGRTVEVPLYQSPDAWMRLKGEQAGSRISGVVRQRDFDGLRPVAWLPFEAKRTGPASIDACKSAMRTGQRLNRD